MQVELEKELKVFKRCHGYDLDLDNPKTYNEKLCHSKLFNRNPLMTLTSDKYRAREYIRDRVPDYMGHLVPVYFVFDCPEFIHLITLPDKYVMKPNHGSGWFVIKDDDYTVDMGRVKYQSLNPNALESIVEAWLKEDYSLRWNEWAYSKVEPLVAVEKLLDRPNDYRLNMFGGKFKFLSVTTPYQKTFNYFDDKLEPVHVGVKPELKDFKMSGEIEQMIKWAELLSADWDFIRCDFLVTDKVYFSELTHYPGAGNTKYPYELDLKLGEYWS